MTKDEKKEAVERLIDHMKDMLLDGIDKMPDNEYHPVELIVSSANTLYMYAVMAQQGMTDEEIAKTMNNMADNLNRKDTTETKLDGSTVTSLLDKVKKKKETTH